MKTSWLAVLVVAAMMLSVTACSQRYQGITSGSSYEADPGSLSDREACINACNSAHAVCMDSGAARRDRDDVPDLFGAGANCDAQLRSCLPGCKGR
ncbi:MAG: hypothetical protein GC131_03630 [Alphaproteobacteria bacterium]|nr:hypothetical protein [Alphaproteobacteria bacterium]